MKIYVVIVAYKGHCWYKRCFDSLRTSLQKLNVIVVDNASNDGTVEYIRENYPEIYLIESKENLGFGRANNLGIKYALDNGCDYVFLLNQDAWIEPNTIIGLINIHVNNLQYGILSPLHLNVTKNQVENGLMHYIHDYRITESRLINDLLFGSLSDVYVSKYINAAAWLLPRRTLEIVGGFDPIFFHYGEDDNYLSRVLFHNLKIGLCPKLYVVHNTEITGVRITSEAEQLRRHQLLLLTRFTDINNEDLLCSYLVYLFRKSMLKLFRLNFKLAKQYYFDMVYLYRKRKDISYSRKCNESKGKTWL